ncbi:hypothetical protein [Actinoplanes sp. NPDC020271]|uniref:hypothetical protein n=1 Tax=Actinoplanes sp. NPDC020271 TaxID=3363896 RepID=UPI0037AFEBE4
MNRTTTTTMLLSLLVTAGLAGCGNHPAPTTAPSSSGLLTLGQEWVQCLRSHGLTRMPDAELSQDGYLEFPSRDYDWKSDLVKHRDIIDACQSVEDRYPANAFRPKQQFSADDLRKLAAYADCVRKHGIPAFPDPNAAGEFDLSGTSLADGIPGALRDQADAACHSVWDGAVKITGGAGGKK